MTETKDLTSKEYFRKIKFVHTFLIAGHLMLAMLVWMALTSGGPMAPVKSDIIFIIVALIFAVFDTIISITMFKTRLNEIKKLNPGDLKGKLSAYMSALIVRYALLVAPSMVGMVFYFKTGNYFFLVITGVMIVLLMMARPEKQTMASDMELSLSEEELLNDPDAIISSSEEGFKL